MCHVYAFWVGWCVWYIVIPGRGNEVLIAVILYLNAGRCRNWSSYIMKRCWLFLNRQSDLKLSFPFTNFTQKSQGLASPRSPPKASAHAASVMFSDTALLRVIDGCVHLNFRIAKRTANDDRGKWNSVGLEGVEDNGQRNDIGVLVCVCALLFWCIFIYFLVLMFFDNWARYCTEDLLTKQQENRKPPHYFLPGPASPCLKASGQGSVEV